MSVKLNTTQRCLEMFIVSLLLLTFPPLYEPFLKVFSWLLLPRQTFKVENPQLISRTISFHSIFWFHGSVATYTTNPKWLSLAQIFLLHSRNVHLNMYLDVSLATQIHILCPQKSACIKTLTCKLDHNHILIWSEEFIIFILPPRVTKHAGLLRTSSATTTSFLEETAYLVT